VIHQCSTYRRQWDFSSQQSNGGITITFSISSFLVELALIRRRSVLSNALMVT